MDKIYTAEASQNSKLPSLSKTPVPVSSKNHPKVIQTEKSDFELELGPKHRILKSMINTEKQDVSSNDTSCLNYSFKRMSAGMKVIGNYSNKLSHIKKIFENLHTANEPSFKINDSINTANKKCMERDYNIWAKKRAKKALDVNKLFNQFLKRLFECLDENQDDLVSANVLVIQLLSYGIAQSPKYIEKAIKLIFEASDLENLNISKKKFVESLKETKIKLSILKNLQSQLFYSYSFSSEPIGKIEDFVKVIKAWWNELSPDSHFIPTSKVAKFLVSKKIMPNLSKSMKFISEYTKDNIIDSNCFEKLFFSSIFHGQLLNIKNEVEKEERDSPMKMKISSHQRNILISGANPIVQENDRTVLESVYKYHQKIHKNDKIDLRNVAREILDTIEKNNQFKLKQKIYEAEKDASQFIDQDGDIKKDLKDIWDIKNFNESTKEKRESDKDSDNKILNIRDSSPFESYARKVRIFRDNFLFERFQSVANKCPNLIT